MILGYPSLGTPPFLTYRDYSGGPLMIHDFLPHQSTFLSRTVYEKLNIPSGELT